MPTLFTQITPLKPEKDITLARGCLQLGAVCLIPLLLLVGLLWIAWRLYRGY